MDPEIARAAETLAEHALLLLGAGIALVAVAAAAVLAAVRLARSHHAAMAALANTVSRRLRQLPVLGPVLARARGTVPGRHLAIHLALGLVATAAVVAFVVVAEEVVAGREVAAFDVAFARALQQDASPAWQRVFRVVTWFGSTQVLVILSLPVAVQLFLSRRRALAVGWILGQAGGGLLVLTLKNVFQRTRPEFADAVLANSSFSFPSGHALSTFVFCGLGAYVLLRSTRSWTRGAVVVAAAVGWCLLMGFTRLYLGVHYASDVVAGLVAATAWVAVCVSATEAALRRPARRHEA
jgi:undecaprenyl-diphosphatase